MKHLHDYLCQLLSKELQTFSLMEKSKKSWLRGREVKHDTGNLNPTAKKNESPTKHCHLPKEHWLTEITVCSQKSSAMVIYKIDQ